jgi:elongation factor Ts
MSTVAITASDVNKLRSITGAGMMDCKKALTEAEGDFEKAIDILRKKGQKVAANRSDRDAKEGYVIAQTAGDTAVILSLNCETDFVAKNAEFGKLATDILNLALNNKAKTIEDVLALIMADNRTVAEHITEAVGKIGEKIEISSYGIVTGATVVAYNHPGNRVATIVAFNKPTDEAMAKDVAMQAAAMAPIAIDKEDVPQDVLERELEIAREQVRQEGKPEDMVEKIAAGKINKFYKEATLNNQEFIKDNKLSVAQYVQQGDKERKIIAFKRIALS